MESRRQGRKQGDELETFIVVKAKAYSLHCGDRGSVGPGPLGSTCQDRVRNPRFNGVTLVKGKGGREQVLEGEVFTYQCRSNFCKRREGSGEGASRGK